MIRLGPLGPPFLQPLGSTIRVSAVELIRPPITTVAGGPANGEKPEGTCVASAIVAVTAPEREGLLVNQAEVTEGASR